MSETECQNAKFSSFLHRRDKNWYIDKGFLHLEQKRGLSSGLPFFIYYKILKKGPNKTKLGVGLIKSLCINHWPTPKSASTYY